MSNDDVEKIFAEEGLSLDSPKDGEAKVQDLLNALPLSTDAQCSKCNATTRSVCPTCHGAFCENHASNVDARYCSTCLSEAALDVKISPLTSPNGVNHDGRSLQPTGPAFGTLSKRICEMSDFELESHIQYYKDLVHQAERSLDVRRIILGASQIEQSQRADATRRHLRASGYKAKPVALKGADGKTIKPQSKTSTANAMASALNVKPEALSAILSLLGTPKK